MKCSKIEFLYAVEQSIVSKDDALEITRTNALFFSRKKNSMKKKHGCCNLGFSEINIYKHTKTHRTPNTRNTACLATLYVVEFAYKLKSGHASDTTI